jgi:C4-dicarboxylate transporter DctQ subunit
MLALRSLLARGADAVAAGLLAAIFLTFLYQIAGRYLLTHFGLSTPGWTVELCLTLWLWLVFWGAAFCLKDSDHVSFDILYQAVNPRMQRLFALVSAVAIIVGLVTALPADWDYITFYKIKKSATLKIRLDYVFSIYAIFAVAVIAQYALRIAHILRGGAIGRTVEPTPGHEGD